MNYRNRHLEKVLVQYTGIFKIVLITGARQVGKSSLLENTFPDYKTVVFDPIRDIYGAREDPDLFLDNFPAPLILDEIQYAPEILPSLKRRVDKNEKKGQYILTGSQNILMLRNVSESLAGRVGIIHLDSMTLSELNGYGETNNFWLELFLNDDINFSGDIKYINVDCGPAEIVWRGMLPGLLDNDNFSVRPYLDSYIRTYIERDVRLLENVQDLTEFDKFVRLVCALTAQEINYSQFGREIGMSPNTAKKWLHLLIHSYLWIELNPYHTNTIKRISRKPKGHFMDSGIICNQLFIQSSKALAANPNFGNIFESWTVAELIKKSKLLSYPPAMYHWRTNGGAEVDIVFEMNSFLYPIEIKLKSIISKNDIRGLKSFFKTYPDKTKQAAIIYTGKECYRIDNNIWAIPWNAI